MIFASSPNSLEFELSHFCPFAMDEDFKLAAYESGQVIEPLSVFYAPGDFETI